MPSDIAGLGAGQKIARLENERDLYLGILVMLTCEKLGSIHPAVSDEVRSELKQLANQSDNTLSGVTFGDDCLTVKQVRKLGRGE